MYTTHRKKRALFFFLPQSSPKKKRALFFFSAAIFPQKKKRPFLTVVRGKRTKCALTNHKMVFKIIVLNQRRFSAPVVFVSPVDHEYMVAVLEEPERLREGRQSISLDFQEQQQGSLFKADFVPTAKTLPRNLSKILYAYLLSQWVDEGLVAAVACFVLNKPFWLTESQYNSLMAHAQTLQNMKRSRPLSIDSEGLSFKKDLSFVQKGASELKTFAPWLKLGFLFQNVQIERDSLVYPLLKMVSAQMAAWRSACTQNRRKRSWWKQEKIEFVPHKKRVVRSLPVREESEERDSLPSLRISVQTQSSVIFLYDVARSTLPVSTVSVDDCTLFLKGHAGADGYVELSTIEGNGVFERAARWWALNSDKGKQAGLTRVVRAQSYPTRPPWFVPRAPGSAGWAVQEAGAPTPCSLKEGWACFREQTTGQTLMLPHDRRTVLLEERCVCSEAKRELQKNVVHPLGVLAGTDKSSHTKMGSPDLALDMLLRAYVLCTDPEQAFLHLKTYAPAARGWPSACNECCSEEGELCRHATGLSPSHYQQMLTILLKNSTLLAHKTEDVYKVLDLPWLLSLFFDGLLLVRCAKTFGLELGKNFFLLYKFYSQIHCLLPNGDAWLRGKSTLAQIEKTTEHAFRKVDTKFQRQYQPDNNSEYYGQVSLETLCGLRSMRMRNLPRVGATKTVGALLRYAQGRQTYGSLLRQHGVAALHNKYKLKYQESLMRLLCSRQQFLALWKPGYPFAGNHKGCVLHIPEDWLWSLAHTLVGWLLVEWEIVNTSWELGCWVYVDRKEEALAAMMVEILLQNTCFAIGIISYHNTYSFCRGKPVRRRTGREQIVFVFNESVNKGLVGRALLLGECENPVLALAKLQVLRTAEEPALLDADFGLALPVPAHEAHFPSAVQHQEGESLVMLKSSEGQRAILYLSLVLLLDKNRNENNKWSTTGVNIIYSEDIYKAFTNILKAEKISARFKKRVGEEEVPCYPQQEARSRDGGAEYTTHEPFF